MSRQTKLRQALREAFRDPSEADIDLAYRLMTGENERHELDSIPAVQDLVAGCYNPPGRHYKVMTALNVLLGTHGCEYLGHVDMHDGPPVEYLNVGDAYTVTVVWYRDLKQPWRAQGYADALEWLEKRRYRLDDT